ncbi:MAG: BolA family transcriptional regulator [Gammaproteobacteria bacterium]|nr:BolA family transcriptional regulator [Gammaproteobacteria bacterium]
MAGDKIEDRSARLRRYLEDAFQPTHLEITDDSHAHAGHSHQGGGHFSVTLCSGHFEGKSLVERHRMVYGAVAAMMPQDIHALSIRAFAPTEASGG